MTDNEIIMDWLNNPNNMTKLTTIGYREPVYKFILATCTCISVGHFVVFKVGESWHPITCIHDNP